MTVPPGRILSGRTIPESARFVSSDKVHCATWRTRPSFWREPCTPVLPIARDEALEVERSPKPLAPPAEE